jgi:inorganic pyrophosphatase
MSADVQEIECMGPAFMVQLFQFFVTYNGLKGRGFKVVGIGDARRAADLIVQAGL